MEGDTIMLQDLFTFQNDGVDREGHVQGKIVATGIRPRFADQIKFSGQDIDPAVFDYLKL
jgi:pilus assembly protein CpaF